jgi:glucose-1-phosphate thymidylyltransferase
MKAIILAAGYGTRLKEVTKNKPKALLEIARKPLIEHIINRIPKEIREIYIVSNAKFFPQFSDWFNKFQQKHEDYKDKEIILINDGTISNERRLGGLGDLALVIKHAGLDDFLILASDNLFDFDLERIYNLFKHNMKDIVVLYDIQNREKAKLFGVLKIDSTNKIISFTEKLEQPDSILVSTGIYFFKKNTIVMLKEYLKEGNEKEEPRNFVRWLINRLGIYSYVAEGKWYDIGSIESYEEAKAYWQEE